MHQIRKIGFEVTIRCPDCFSVNNKNTLGFPSICSADPLDYYWVDGEPKYYINATHWWSDEGTPAGEHCGQLKLENGQIRFWDLYYDTIEMLLLIIFGLATIFDRQCA